MIDLDCLGLFQIGLVCYRLVGFDLFDFFGWICFVCFCLLYLAAFHFGIVFCSVKKAYCRRHASELCLSAFCALVYFPRGSRANDLEIVSEKNFPMENENGGREKLYVSITSQLVSVAEEFSYYNISV